MINRTLALLAILVAFLWLINSVGAAEEDYPVPPEGEVRAGVPAGKIEGPFEFRSAIFPGTVREYWVYVPAQYDAEKPACLMIVQDGLGMANNWRLPAVLDNMIHSGEIPVQLGIFVGHGSVPASNDTAQPRFNRSFEYDSLGDRYAKFLIDELLPEVAKTWKISTNPDDRCLAGASSGGICAFTAAWERPDQFGKVLSWVGSFVDLRGGHVYPSLIRLHERKPVRVYLMDGTNDLDNPFGNWPLANRQMEAALKFQGWDYRMDWSECFHGSKGMAPILPDALRWLWRP